jgi:acetylornithine deacetylase/succinyl-diaminopimelate desuccinylase-like protein
MKIIPMSDNISYIDTHKERFLNELVDLLRIPSVSTDKSFKDDVIRAAEYIKDRLVEAGADNVEVCPTGGYPIVYGEKIIDPSLPTVLVYGHYDVQPADPIELWDSPPFEPVVTDTLVIARGAADDKGQMYMHVKAFESMMKTNTLACNIKFMIEGEEEIGSDSLGPFLEQNKDRLSADVVLVSDTAMLSNENPSITMGLRGLSYVEVEVTGPNRDLHSGIYGGAIANPINVLAKMIASLHDENHHITIPGFYDDVIEISPEERIAMNQAPFDLKEYQDDLGIKSVHGEKGYTSLERASIRPTLDVNGIWGGYTAPGAKTVLPSKAYAKISMRLVPNQSPDEITALFTRHFTGIAPDYVTVKVNAHHGGEPAVTPINSIAYKAASLAMEETFGKTPIPMRGGGSIPIVALFEKTLGLKTILMGFGLDSNKIHSPNENYGLFNYYKGIETIPLFFKYLAALSNNN